MSLVSFEIKPFGHVMGYSNRFFAEYIFYNITTYKTIREITSCKCVEKRTNFSSLYSLWYFKPLVKVGRIYFDKLIDTKLLFIKCDIEDLQPHIGEKLDGYCQSFSKEKYLNCEHLSNIYLFSFTPPMLIFESEGC